VNATDYYVSPTGNNGNNGLSASSPKADFSWFSSSIPTSDDTVWLLGGTWSDKHIVFLKSGTSGHPITLRAYSGTPILDGFDSTGIGINVNGKNYITIRDIKITRYATGINQEPSGGLNLTVYNVTFTNIPTTALNLKASSRSSKYGNISYNTFDTVTNSANDDQCAYTGAISYYQMYDTLISHNYVTNTYGFVCGWVLERNEISFNNFTNNPGRFFSAWGGHYTKILNNVLMFTGDRGIRFDKDGRGIEIKNNYLKDVGYDPVYPASAIDIYGNNTMEFVNNTLVRSWFLIDNHVNTTISGNIFKCDGQAVDISYTTEGLESPKRHNENVTVSNNIFYNCIYVKIQGMTNGGSVRNNIFHTAPVAIDGTSYTLEYNNLYNSALTGGTSSNSITTNPLFVNPNAEDFHLKSQYGRWAPTAGWVYDMVTSPAIDKGKPIDDFSKEPLPNGGRIDLGAYGNMVEASKSNVRFINGIVKDNSTGNSFSGVNVSADSILSTTTNASGFYSFAVSDGTYNLTAIYDIRYYTNITTVSTIGQVVVWQDIELINKPTGNITGSVAE
jgi:hypothetical protein